MPKVTVDLNEQGQISVQGDSPLHDMFILALLDLGAEVIRRKIMPIQPMAGRVEVPRVVVEPVGGRN